MPNVRKLEREKPAATQLLRVAAYARVSKDTAELMHSLSVQVSYYSSLIKSHPGWDYAGVYVDAGISGTRAELRPEFQRMIADCEAGRIDIVLTKSISRFARNTVDLLQTVRRLKELGVEVWFERENIRTFSGDGEVMLSILASFAQEESYSLSKNIKWTFQKKFKRGEPHAHKRALGYRWEGDRMVVVPEEAETVRYIFREFAGGRSTFEIARALRERGVTGMTGKPFAEISVRAILRNHVYLGQLIMQKEYNLIPKKHRINRGELPMYVVDGHHEAIVSQELFDAAEREFERRSEAHKAKPRFDNPLTGKVWCGKCGAKALWHRLPSDRRAGVYGDPRWVCAAKNRNGQCDCRNISDSELRGVPTKLGVTTEDIIAIRYSDDALAVELRNGRKQTLKREQRRGIREWHH